MTDIANAIYGAGFVLTIPGQILGLPHIYVSVNAFAIGGVVVLKGLVSYLFTTYADHAEDE